MTTCKFEHLLVDRVWVPEQFPEHVQCIFDPFCLIHVVEVLSSVRLAARQPGELQQIPYVPRDLVRVHIVEPPQCRKQTSPRTELEVGVAKKEKAAQHLQAQQVPPVLDRTHPACVEPWSLAARAMTLQCPSVAVQEVHAQLGQGWVLEKVCNGVLLCRAGEPHTSLSAPWLICWL